MEKFNSFKHISRKSQIPKPGTHSSSRRCMSSIFQELKPNQVLQRYKSSLTEYEQSEIQGYQEIFYIGLRAQKQASDSLDSNHGFDDVKGCYRAFTGDHIAYRYEIRNKLGKGTFGTVYSCFDHKRREKVALKIIRNKKGFNLQAKTEIKILSKLRNEANVIRMKNYFMFRQHVCIVFELLQHNLYDFTVVNDYQGLPLHLIKKISLKVLRSLEVLGKNGIIHCDIKPENIMVNSNDVSALKIIDFGASCFESERAMSYIQSRFYRAPEVILGVPYNSPIDIWSFGCMLAELYIGCPLFPGNSEQDQLSKIIEVKGLPPPPLLKTATRYHLFFDGLELIDKKCSPGATSLESVLMCSDKSFVNLVSRCLAWDPCIRITPSEAIKHSWLMKQHK